jgi:ribonuclease VapC
MPSSPQIVLDASAIIAYLDAERGAEIVENWLPESAVSMVNVCEVISVLVRQGNAESEVSSELRALIPAIIPFDWPIACAAAGMILSTQPQGLGLGDRAALATARHMRIPVLTAEKRWLDVSVGVDVQLIRPRT